jgi:RNA polymerase sigma-70 factor (ECF subfamily)
MFKYDPLAHPEELIRRVYSYIAYRIGDGPEAEDVTSEVFERAVKYRASYDGRRAKPVTWLLGIARHCISEHYARRGRDELRLGEPASGGDLESDTVERLAVRAAVERLDDRERELIALRYGADLKAREIAVLLGERTNTVEVALHRALARLRAALEPQRLQSSSPAEAPPDAKPATEA